MSNTSLNRRAFLALSASGTALASTAALARDGLSAPTEFTFEVTHTDAEWRAKLTDAEYNILRERGTELPQTSPYWNTNTPGTYHCAGCDLPLYESKDYSPQDIGFVFFEHAIPHSTLLSTDITDYNGALSEPLSFMEPVCRRCGSHLGHIVVINNTALHCINGTALKHRPVTA